MQQQQQRARTFVLLEALSATGLRAIRYAKEIPRVRCVARGGGGEVAARRVRTLMDGLQIRHRERSRAGCGCGHTAERRA